MTNKHYNHSLMTSMVCSDQTTLVHILYETSNLQPVEQKTGWIVIILPRFTGQLGVPNLSLSDSQQ